MSQATESDTVHPVSRSIYAQRAQRQQQYAAFSQRGPSLRDAHGTSPAPLPRDQYNAGSSSQRSVASPTLSSGYEELGPYGHIAKSRAAPTNQRRPNASPSAADRKNATDSVLSDVSYGANSSQTKHSQGSTAHYAHTTEELLYADDLDDELHAPWKKGDDNHFACCSSRGCVNMITLSLVLLGMLALFAGYPIIYHFLHGSSGKMGGFNLGGSNGSGQVPDLNIFSLIDADTPADAQRWLHPLTGDSFHLVFSDEFEQEGRTFWPGDDPFWEAVDIWYGATGDVEWYSPEAVNTTGGSMQITMTETVRHNLNFQSGMVQSWQKFCFQGGYIEFSALLPGSPQTVGYWPGLWTMGNLARPGYLGSSDGMWPYSYDSCDTGILKNQTTVDGTGPAPVVNAAKKLSYLPGMKASSCTCPGEDHPGPNHSVGRSAPELDVLEAQISKGVGQASQSLQTAPYDVAYAWKNTSQFATLYDEDISHFNSYTGGVYQEAVSGLTDIPDDAYELATNPRFVRFGVQFTPDWNGDGSGSVTWFIDGKATWTLHGSAIGPDPSIDIGQRLIPVEPMAIIMNLGMSRGFLPMQFDTLVFPASLKVSC